MNNINRFKFRIWDNGHDKRWITGTCEYLHDEKIFDLQESTNTDKDDWVIQQYIGVNDRNGMEIFEGDILSFIENNKEISEVRYLDDCALFCAFIIDHGDGIKRLRSNVRLFGDFPGDRFTIIGNIFDNPELLIVKYLYE